MRCATCCAGLGDGARGRKRLCSGCEKSLCDACAKATSARSEGEASDVFLCEHCKATHAGHQLKLENCGQTFRRLQKCCGQYVQYATDNGWQKGMLHASSSQWLSELNFLVLLADAFLTHSRFLVLGRSIKERSATERAPTRCILQPETTTLILTQGMNPTLLLPWTRWLLTLLVRFTRRQPNGSRRTFQC